MADVLTTAFGVSITGLERGVVAIGVVVLVVLVVLLLRMRRRDRSGHAAEGTTGLLLVPDAPAEDVEVVSSASILGVDPVDPGGRFGRPWQLMLALVALIAAGAAAYLLLVSPSSETGPVPVAQDRTVSSPVEDRPVRYTVEDGPEPTGDATADLAVDSVRGIRMISWSGNSQEGEPDRPLRRAISVVIRDSLDQPLEGVPVHFDIPEGGGHSDPARVETNEMGLATATWWLGSVEDSLRVDIRAAGRPDLHLVYTATFTERGREILEREPETEEQVRPSEPAAPRFSPRSLAALRPRASLAVGGIHTCYLTPQSEPVCLGGGEGSRVAATDVSPNSPTMRTVVAGVFHSCGVSGQGTVVCWPARSGDRGSPAAPTEPIALPSGAIPVDVVAGSEHSCALASSGAVFCWGNNTHGQLGDGSTTDSAEPVRVQDLPPAAQISTGWLHTCALARDGTPYCWGANAAGQLGDGTTRDRLVARPVATDTRFTMLSAGSAHTCARTPRGSVLCWGSNDKGQLGHDATVSTTPLRVDSSVDFASVVAGGTHTCGLSEDARAWCWGNNTYGQLGNGTTSGGPTPTRVAGDFEFVALESGAAHTCGQLENEQIYCWGNNIQGQLGDGTRENRSRPVRLTAVRAQ